MDRSTGNGGSTLAVLGVAAALVVLHALLSLPVAPARGMATDFVDPVRGALRVLSGDLWPLGTAVHGWGRDLSFVPLVAGMESWVEHALRRAWLQCWVPLAAFFAARALLGDDRDGPGGLAGPFLAAAVLSFDERLGHVISGTHQGYIAVEWAALMALGVAGLLRGVRPRLSGLALGIGATMSVFNTPYALALAGVGTIAVVVAWRRGDRGAAALAVGAALALMAPHVGLLLTAPPEVLYPYEASGALLDRMREVVGEQDFTAVDGVRGFTGGLVDPAGLALSAAVGLALVGLGSGRARPLGLAALGLALAVPLGAGLSVWVAHTKPWHATPLLPFGAMVAGAGMALGGRRLLELSRVLGAVAVGAAVVGTAWIAVRGVESRQDRVTEAEVPIRADHLDRVGRLLATGGVDQRDLRAMAGDLTAQQPWQELLLPLVLGGDRPGDGEILYVQGGPSQIEEARAVPAAGRLLGAGDDWIAWRPTSPDRRRRWTAGFCAAGETEQVRRSDPGLPRVLLLSDGRFASGERHPCVRGGERPTIPAGLVDGGWLGADRAARDEEFVIDSVPASERAWVECVEDGGCTGGPVGRSQLPARVDAGQARAFCAWRGGRLARRSERVAAGVAQGLWSAPPRPVEPLDTVAEDARDRGAPPVAREHRGPVGTQPSRASVWGVEDLDAAEWIADGDETGVVGGAAATAWDAERAGVRCVYSE